MRVARALAILVVAFVLHLVAASVGTAATAPVGTVGTSGSATLPAGWLWADGSAVSRVAYPELFAVIGTTHGVGDGSTTFNLPDLRRRSPMGVAASGTGSTLGGSGGAFDHSHTVAGHGHTIGADGSHTHGVDPHTHAWVSAVGLNSGSASLIRPDDPTLDNVGRYDFFTVVNATITCCTAAGVQAEEYWYQTSTADGATANAAGSHDHGGAGSASSSTDASNAPWLALNGIIKSDPAAADPCGMVWGTTRSAAPAGAYLADGAARGRAADSHLFGCLGTAFGAGDGSTTFNVPDLRQRFPMGRAASGTGSVLGSSGGAIDHTHAVAGHAHSIGSAGSHAHSTTAHSHQQRSPVGANSGRVSYFPPNSPWLDGVGSTDLLGVTTGPSACCYPVMNDLVELWRIVTNAASPNTDTQGTHDHGGATGSSGATATAANPPFQAINYGIDRVAGTQARVGTVLPFAGATAPAGWKFANGAALSRASFADLFATSSTAFGAGDGSTTFNLPDLRQRMPLGRAAAGTGSTLGGTGGAIDHAHATTAHSHSIGGVGNHGHTVDSHAHNFVSSVSASSGNIGTIIPGDPALNSTGSYQFEGVINTPVNFYHHVYYGLVELWVVTTSSASPGTSAAGGHSHGGTTGSASPGTGSANAPYLALNQIVAVDLDGPSVPTLVSPADLASVLTDPALTATYLDAVTSTFGRVEFQLCADSGCSSVLQSGSSASNLATGSNGSWTPAALAEGTYHWRARNVDGGDNTSAWSATRRFDVSYVSLAMSTLGHADAARDTTAPWGLAFGTFTTETSREIGPAGSGQALAGSAVRLDVSSSRTYDVSVQSTTWTSGPQTLPASTLKWSRFGVADAWNAFSTVLTLVENDAPAGTASHQYDLRVDVPPAQPVGSYAASVTYTVVANP